MNVKRAAVFGAVGALVAAMIAGAATSLAPRPTPMPAPAGDGVELQGADLAAEIERLQERLRPTAQPLTPARNLFEYRRPPSAFAPSAPPAAVAPAPSPEPLLPAFHLIGIADEEGDSGPVRTAIISESGGVLLVKEGEMVAGRWLVVSIAGETVDLRDPDGATLRLVFR
jgi:hypothetical protein